MTKPREATPHPGPTIRAARLAVGLTQIELAATVKRSPYWACCFEHGITEATPAEIVKMRAAIKKAAHDRIAAATAATGADA